MLFQTRTRRNAVVALVLISLLVCGGLGWATVIGLRLERIEAETMTERARLIADEASRTRLALALAHLDEIVDSVLLFEKTRPIEQYRGYYTPSRAVSVQSSVTVPESTRIESPLLQFRGPRWVLLHFQASPLGWSSPELERDPLMSSPAPNAIDQSRLDSAVGWIAALRDHYDPFTVQQLLECSQQAELDRANALERLEKPGAGEAHRGSSHRAAHREIDRTAAEFARRGQRLVEMQKQYFPSPQCEPLMVAIENLQTGDDPSSADENSAECALVSATNMMPVWLDLTMDERKQLALIRAVTVEASSASILQGFLLDWGQLQKMLEREVQEILPGAKIEPVEIGAPFDPTMLRTLPARLVAAPAPAVAGFAADARGLTWGLILTWSATLLALSAICWGTMKYVGILERRMHFVAAVTHELRTPLTSFQLYTDLLADLGDDAAKREQCIGTLRKESKRLARLVENVLVYSRIGGAKPHLNIAAVEPQAILDAIARQTTDQCAASGKQLVLENRCRAETRVETDAEFVVQILANLVENACKYSKGAADPRVWVTARGGGPAVTFEVEDRGEGVAASERRAIFRPFQRSAAASRAQTTGMGLGLALSRFWATCLGGRLDLKRGEHDGTHFTRFSLRLPSPDPQGSPSRWQASPSI